MQQSNNPRKKTSREADSVKKEKERSFPSLTLVKRVRNIIKSDTEQRCCDRCKTSTRVGDTSEAKSLAVGDWARECHMGGVDSRVWCVVKLVGADLFGVVDIVVRTDVTRNFDERRLGKDRDSLYNVEGSTVVEAVEIKGIFGGVTVEVCGNHRCEMLLCKGRNDSVAGAGFWEKVWKEVGLDR